RQLLAFDRRSFLRAGSLDIPGVQGEASSLVAWGTDGLAFRTDEDQVVLLRTRLRTPAVVAADLSLVGTASPNPVAPGAKVTYTLTVTNHGPDAASAITLQDMLPAGAGFVSVDSTQGACTRSEATLTCKLGSLASGATAKLTVIVQAAA